MPQMVTDCPRCGAQSITFDVTQQHKVGARYEWQAIFEVFCVCRACRQSTTFVISLKEPDKYVLEHGVLDALISIDNVMRIESFVSLKDFATVNPPDHLPAGIENAFREGARCLSVECPNAASTMFRLCIDLATKGFLPDREVQGLNAKTRRDLGLRLPWLFESGLLPRELRDLSTCIKEDGNDGAHAGTLSMEDAEDVLDFTSVLLDRLYTEPRRIELAAARRTERRRK